jgi:hypothetical protein
MEHKEEARKTWSNMCEQQIGKQQGRGVLIKTGPDCTVNKYGPPETKEAC